MRHSIAYFLALRAAKVPVEMHIYAHGGHAFGLRPTAMPVTLWPKLVARWLRTIGIVTDRSRPVAKSAGRTHLAE